MADILQGYVIGCSAIGMVDRDEGVIALSEPGTGRRACYATGAEFGDVKRFTFEYRGFELSSADPFDDSIGLSIFGNMIPSKFSFQDS